MEFQVRNNYKRDRYIQLLELPNFKETITEKKYNRTNYFIGLFLEIIFGFMLGYTIYYWAAKTIKEIISSLILVVVLLIVFIFIMQFVRDLVQAIMFKDAKNIISFFNSPFNFSTLQSDIDITNDNYLLSLVTPFIIFSLLPCIIIFLGIENVFALIIAFSMAIVATPDLTQSFYLIKFIKYENYKLQKNNSTNNIDTNIKKDLDNKKVLYSNNIDSEINNLDELLGDELSNAVKELKK